MVGSCQSRARSGGSETTKFNSPWCACSSRLRDGGFPLREERLAERGRFAHVERIVCWLPERAPNRGIES